MFFPQGWPYRSEMATGVVTFTMLPTPLKGFDGDVYHFEHMRLRTAMRKFIQMTGEKWRPRIMVDVDGEQQKYSIGNPGDWSKLVDEEKDQIHEDIDFLPNVPVADIKFYAPLTVKCNLVSENFFPHLFLFLKIFFFFSSM